MYDICKYIHTQLVGLRDSYFSKSKLLATAPPRGRPTAADLVYQTQTSLFNGLQQLLVSCLSMAQHGDLVNPIGSRYGIFTYHKNHLNVWVYIYQTWILWGWTLVFQHVTQLGEASTLAFGRSGCFGKKQMKNGWEMIVCLQTITLQIVSESQLYFFYINAYIDEKNAKETIYSFKRIHCISKFECNYIYLDHPFGCQISAPNGLVLVVKGPKFQTLEGFRYTCYKSHLANGPWNKTLNFTYFPY